MTNPLWQALVAVATPQTGLVTRRQAIAAGYKDMQWQRLVESGAVPQLARGVYEVIAPQEGDLRDLHAVALLCGSGSVFSHRSAARLHELWGVDGFPLEVTVPRRLKVDLPSVRVHCGEVDAIDVCQVSGLRATTLVRTLLDLAPLVDPVTFACLLESARRQRPYLLDVLAARLGVSGLAADVQRMVSMLMADCDSRKRPMDSPFEIQFWHRWAYTGLPMPVPQFEVLDRDGSHLFIDFAWPELRVAVETNGYETRKTGESFDHDSSRTMRLAALGWRGLGVTYTQFREDFFGEVTDGVRRYLAEAQGAVIGSPASSGSSPLSILAPAPANRR